MAEDKEPGKLILVTGPSGAGKKTIIDAVLETPGLDCKLAISVTTRKPRDGEIDGKDYYFVGTATFERYIQEGKFLEHARYADNYYGTLREEIEAPLAAGQSVLLELEVQGAAQVRTKLPSALSIFIVPPEPMIETLRQRLAKRGTETPERIERRLEIAQRELTERHRFDRVIVNDDRKIATAEVAAYLRANLRFAQTQAKATTN